MHGTIVKILLLILWITHYSHRTLLCNFSTFFLTNKDVTSNMKATLTFTGMILYFFKLNLNKWTFYTRTWRLNAIPLKTHHRTQSSASSNNWFQHPEHISFRSISMCTSITIPALPSDCFRITYFPKIPFSASTIHMQRTQTCGLHSPNNS